eukprot:s1461_g13.t1
MGRKANNLPIRLARKKKIKDRNNLQIQGRAGLGRRREKGREEQRKTLQKRGQKAVAEAPAPKQLSYLDLAKQQEEKAAKIATQEAVQPVQPPEGKKGRKKKRKRAADGTERTEQWERSHVLPKADLRRDDTVQFGAASEAAPEADDSGPSPFPLVAAAGLEVAGSLALLCDLKAQPELNGQLATLMRWDEGAGRWHVRLQDSEKRLKPENLALKALLRPGVPVRLRELRGSQELNGKLGICRAWNSDKLRWLVAVENHGEVLLKAENLEVSLKPGLLVSLFGLKSAALNGREAVCLAPRGDRWHVRLDSSEEKAQTVEAMVWCPRCLGSFCLEPITFYLIIAAVFLLCNCACCALICRCVYKKADEHDIPRRVRASIVGAVGRPSTRPSQMGVELNDLQRHA